MREFLVAIVVAMSLSCPALATAAPKVFVEPFTVAGGDASLAGALQSLFASRLSAKGVQVQQAPAGAQVLVKGSLTQLGKALSIDIAVVEPAGAVVARGFEQGEGQEAIFGALNKLAEKLATPLAVSPGASTREPAATALPALRATPEPATAALPVIHATPKEPGGVLRPDGTVTPRQRLTGIFVAMAPARVLPNGDREVFLARSGSLHYYRMGSKLEQIAEATLPAGDKIVAVDVADLDGDGAPEAYLTVVQGFELASQVWTVNKGHLELVSKNLPYFFRTLSGPGQEGKLYAQQMGRTDDFYGPVYQLKKMGTELKLENPLKLPKAANIFNFTRFSDPQGANYTVVLTADGFLTVYAEDSERELWRSNDKYGGTATFFERDHSQVQRFTGSPVRKVFLQPRMLATSAGEVIVPQNSGTWVVGTSRSYAKHAIYAFAWNGASLEERWHTRAVETFLPDLRFDEERRELLLLEVVKKESPLDSGATTLTVQKID